MIGCPGAKKRMAVNGRENTLTNRNHNSKLKKGDRQVGKNKNGKTTKGGVKNHRGKRSPLREGKKIEN